MVLLIVKPIAKSQSGSDTMQAFVWTPLFETGLADVDGQHLRLVGLLNELGDHVDSGEGGRIDQALQALAEYTVYHFQCEEAIMTARQVDPAHADRHRATHQRFVAQVGDWLARRGRGEAIDLRQLLDFLANWLVFHILGDDQSLGRQVRAIDAGASPAAACAADRASDDPRTEILLASLRRLYAGLVSRNEELLAAQRELSLANATLEQRVAERTAELLEANRRLAEEQERVVEAEKMASLGRMVAGFAHEVNTPIGVAVGAASQSAELVGELHSLLSAEEVSEEDLRSRFDLLGEAASLTLDNLNRAADMVRSFKRTAVDQSSDRVRDYLLAEVIEDVEKNLRNVFKRTSIAIAVDCPADLALHGPAGALIQVLTNLMQNSLVHGFAEGSRSGRISIVARAEGERVLIDYRDDGAGMAAETLPHVFEPFYTTRRGSGGSGLGLYIVYNLITQALLGDIRCISQPGQGVHFRLDLPRSILANSSEPES